MPSRSVRSIIAPNQHPSNQPCTRLQASETSVVKIPSGVLKGFVIGKDASNLRHLSNKTTARFRVVDDTVQISGTSSAVKAGEDMLQLQFKSFKEAGGWLYLMSWPAGPQDCAGLLLLACMSV